MEFSKDLNAASATALILAVLEASPSYGYAIIRQVERHSKGLLKWEEGMLYPILHRLEKQGWIESYWDSAENGRKRKYYRILFAGRGALRDLKQQWEQMDGILRASWEGVATWTPEADSAPKTSVEPADGDDGELPVSLL